MKIYVYSAEDVINKNFEFNNKQTEVGSKLKTYKGSAIQRSKKYGVGKEIGGEIYFHKSYADEIVPSNILEDAIDILHDKYPSFQYNCMKYDPKRHRVAFQECLDFDNAREPVVGDWIAVELYLDGSFNITKGHSNYIFHHKWLFVRNDYSGFDVEDSWNWSKKWLSTLEETSDGNGIGRWNAQLDKYGLPHDN